MVVVLPRRKGQSKRTIRRTKAAIRKLIGGFDDGSKEALIRDLLPDSCKEGAMLVYRLVVPTLSNVCCATGDKKAATCISVCHALNEALAANCSKGRREEYRAGVCLWCCTQTCESNLRNYAAIKDRSS
jgi:hypothetical protein